jgi:phosphohistidine phosphatase
MTETADAGRTLVVLRHAKSSWDAPVRSDHDRPLAPRGRDALPRLHRWLVDRELPIELVLCSSATRARQTLAGVRDAVRDAEVVVDRALYGAAATALLARLHRVPPAVRGVLLVGHNPGLEALVDGLAATGDEAAIEQLRHKYPTGGLATLSVPAPWADLAWGGCELETFVVPRALP